MKDNVFKIGTFNAYNLILPNQTYYGDKMYTPLAYELKLDWIGQQLNNMKADIVGFQEVFHQDALKAAVERAGMYHACPLVTAGPNGNKPTLGLVSRFPIVSTEIIRDFPHHSLLDIDMEDGTPHIQLPFKQFNRPVLLVRLQVATHLQVSVLIVHLKSKRPLIPDHAERNDPLEQAKGKARAMMMRAAEATALRSIVLKLLQKKDGPVILMGDVNDTGLAVTTRLVSGEAPHRKWPMDVKRKVWQQMLYHAQEIQSRQSFHDFYYTHIHNGHYEGLDQIMVSHELVRENPEALGKVVYVSLLNDHLIDETLSYDKAENWQSDHGQVVAHIELERKCGSINRINNH